MQWQRVDRRDPAVGVHGQRGPPDAGQDRRGDGAQPVQRAVVLLAQLGFGQPRHDVDERDGGRMHGRRGSRDVDDTDDLTGAWIPDRRSRAGPRVVAAHEMLGGEHLHGTVGHQRGADGVGADGALAPVGALDEPEPVGVVQHRRRAGAPQHPALRVGDDKDVDALGDNRFQAPRDLVEHRHQARRASQHLQRTGLDHRRALAVGVDSLGHQPLPGVADHLAWSRGRTLAGHRRVVDSRHQPRVRARILADGHRRFRHLHHPRLCSPSHVSGRRRCRARHER